MWQLSPTVRSLAAVVERLPLVIPEELRPRLDDEHIFDALIAAITARAVANAIFEYLEIFHNRQRRHSALGMLTPIEYERQHPLPERIEPVA